LRMGQLCLEIERACRAGAAPSAGAGCRALKAEYDGVKQQIADLVAAELEPTRNA